jgi:hypothetical protein
MLLERIWQEGGGKMLEVQERPIRWSGAGPLLQERTIPVGEMLDYRTAFSEALAQRESDDEMRRVLERAARDNGFIAELTYRGAKALEGYKLTLQAKAALLSGDIRWIEARLGKLNDRLRVWVDCRLAQEIW